MPRRRWVFRRGRGGRGRESRRRRHDGGARWGGRSSLLALRGLHFWFSGRARGQEPGLLGAPMGEQDRTRGGLLLCAKGVGKWDFASL